MLEGKEHGASAGAAAGAGGCLALLQPGGGSDPLFDALVLLVLLPVCLPLAAAAGAVYGATQAAPAQSVEDLRARAEQAPAALHLNEDALQEELDYAQTVGLALTPLDRAAGSAALGDSPSCYARFADSVDSVIELNVLKVSALSTGRNGLPVVFALEGRVRVVATSDGEVLDDYPVIYQGISRPADEWLAAGGAAVHEELARGLHWLALQALDELLLYRPRTHLKSSDDGDYMPSYALLVVDSPLRAGLLATFPNPFKDLICGDGPGQARDVR